jgi:hypothetical protein
VTDGWKETSVTDGWKETSVTDGWKETSVISDRWLEGDLCDK